MPLTFNFILEQTHSQCKQSSNLTLFLQSRFAALYKDTPLATLRQWETSGAPVRLLCLTSAGNLKPFSEDFVLILHTSEEFTDVST